MATERELADQLLARLSELRYTVRSDIKELDSVKRNFREKFQKLNRVNLSTGEFQRHLDRMSFSWMVGQRRYVS